MVAIKVLSPFYQADPDRQHLREGTAEIRQAVGLIPSPRSHARPNQATRIEKHGRHPPSPCWEHSIQWTGAICVRALFMFPSALGEYR